MNARAADRDLPPSAASRVSARSRYSAPPSSAFAASYDYGNNDNYRAASSSSSSSAKASKSKGGINGRSYGSGDEGDELGGLSSRSALRSAAKRSAAAGAAPPSAGSAALGDVERDFLLARQRSTGSAASSAKDRPWRTGSSNSTSSYATAATSRSSAAPTTAANDAPSDVGGATDTEYASDYEVGRSRSGGSDASSKASKSDVEVSSPAQNRWAQYETDDLAKESLVATANAVSDVVTRLAEKAEAAEQQQQAAPAAKPIAIPSAPMGGSAGTGYSSQRPGQATSSQGDLDALESNGNSLPPSVPGGEVSSVSTVKTSNLGGGSSRSTTDYVKSRLSSLAPQRNREVEYERSLCGSSRSRQSEHDKVRNEALKMLQIADSCLSESPRNSISAPGSPRISGSTTGLFRTATGGLSVRELHDNEVNQISIRRDGSKREKASSIAGLDKFRDERNMPHKFDGTFTIGSRDEEDLKAYNSNIDPTSPNEDAPRAWSSRYSVERQLMAITGGLDSTKMLAKMDALHSSREKTKSARGMYRASGYAMDGSHEEYGDYTTGSSTGVGLGGIWLWLKGTLWSDEIELNYDGTTQSLVRRERAMQKRRRLRFAALFLVVFSIVVGVLVHIGNPKGVPVEAVAVGNSKDVSFYVLSDEPYDFDDLGQLTRELESLPDDAEFLIHLGNANGDDESQCQEYGFERAAAVLRESRVPVLVIPGDLDWAACGSEKRAQRALRWWDVNLGRLERSWDLPFETKRADDIVGNLAFLHGGVLFVGVSLVDAETEPSEAKSRLERNVAWTRDKIRERDPAEFRAVVIFGHAPPGPRQEDYFDPVSDLVAGLGKPALYVHANSRGSFEQYAPFNGVENFEVVQLEKRGREAPMHIAVRGDGKGVDFAFERRDLTMERVEK